MKPQDCRPIWAIWLKINIFLVCELISFSNSSPVPMGFVIISVESVQVMDGVDTFGRGEQLHELLGNRDIFPSAEVHCLFVLKDV